jgi:hypothetical protein
MAYVKPGIEITQQQVTVSPNLIEPDLGAVMIGAGYFVAEPDDFSYTDTYDDGAGSDVDFAGVPSGGEIDTDSVYVDLIIASGIDAGQVIHLASSEITPDADGVAISSGLAATYSGYQNVNGAAVKIGYRALRTDLDYFMEIVSFTEIEERIGKPVSYNPLAVCLSKALTSAGNRVYAVPLRDATGPEDSTEKAAALDTLKTREVYVLLPITDSASIIGEFKTHAVTWSEPENKKERMVVGCPAIPWTGAAGEELSDTAAAVKTASYSHQERRLTMVFPDVAYMLETRHVSTLTTTYLDDVQDLPQSGLLALLAQQYVVTVGGVKYTYRVGTEVTGVVLTNLKTDNSYLQVYVPIPGYVLGAAIAGQISGKNPELPLTNVPIPGIVRVKYSTDVFSETHLDTMAEGGNYIVVQNSLTSPVYCRHQLTTDMTSVERRELNILTTLDFVAKFIRNGVQGYIGRYNITPAFLKLLTMTIQAQILYLTREGIVNDMKLLELKQDPAAADTILVTLDVGVKYPVNYIKITLQF